MQMALPLDGWLPQLLSPQADVAERAREALGASLASMDEALRDRAAELLLRALGRDQPALTAEALHLLQASWFPTSPALAERAVQAVLDALPHLDAEAPAVEDAALLLASVCREAPGQLAAVEAALRHEHPGPRRAAAGALGRVGEDAAPLCGSLVDALADSHTGVGDAALLSLCALAPLAVEVVAPALLDVARVAQGPRRYQALTALRGLLEEARTEGQAQPEGLAAIDDVLLQAMSSDDAATRLEATACSGALGDTSAPVRAGLCARLEDPSPEVRAHAACALLRLESSHQDALAVLQALLQHADPAPQQAAMSALEGLEAAVLGQRPLHALLDKVSARAPTELADAIRELQRLGETAAPDTSR
ncbi:MAG: HEAT repeat domain-containing protein [Pseudomonadota bacterium]